MGNGAVYIDEVIGLAIVVFSSACFQVVLTHHLTAVHAVPVDPALFSHSRRQLLANAAIAASRVAA